MAQGSAEMVVEPLAAGVCRDLRCYARQQQTAQGLRSVALQGEEVLELADHSFDDLTLARCPAAILLRKLWSSPEVISDQLSVISDR